ncbi:hypothetical protein [Trabulsiella guamensis]|uniref:hypothetical protein n=1 Tax=Trabulsiella guamensis TaxID=158852 RepID=UPI0005719BF8|nr:hypothetical protein [Trabulsiella guamensis]
MKNQKLAVFRASPSPRRFTSQGVPFKNTLIKLKYFNSLIAEGGGVADVVHDAGSVVSANGIEWDRERATIAICVLKIEHVPVTVININNRFI